MTSSDMTGSTFAAVDTGITSSLRKHTCCWHVISRASLTAQSFSSSMMRSCSHTFSNLQGLRGIEEVPGQTKQAGKLPEEVVQKDQKAPSIETANTKTKPLRGFQELIKVPQGISMYMPPAFLRFTGAPENTQLLWFRSIHAGDSGCVMASSQQRVGSSDAWRLLSKSAAFH